MMDDEVAALVVDNGSGKSFKNTRDFRPEKTLFFM